MFNFLGRSIIAGLIGFLVGTLLFLLSFYLIFINEQSSVERVQTLKTGISIIKSVDANNPGLLTDNPLVHISGKTQSAEMMSDPDFKLIKNAIKLKRTVLMYQWKQTQSDEKSNKTDKHQSVQYEYNKVWSPVLIHSDSFHNPSAHTNPALMPYFSHTFVIDPIKIGLFTLDDVFINQITNFSPASITQDEFDKFSSDKREYFNLVNGTLYHGSYDDPQIGDVKVSFSMISPEIISAIGEAHSNQLTSYYSEHGVIHLLHIGQADANTMFQIAINNNKIKTWLFRIGCFVLMWISINLILSPLTQLTRWVPVIGQLVGLSLIIVTALIACSLSLITIALSWFIVRPLLGLALLFFAAVMISVSLKITHKKNKNE